MFRFAVKRRPFINPYSFCAEPLMAPRLRLAQKNC